MNKPSLSDFAALLDANESQFRKGFTPGEKVAAKVIAIGKQSISLDVRAKRDGIIAREELSDAEGNVSVVPGDTIDVVFVAADNGAFIFSARSTSGAAPIDRSLADAAASGLPVEGKVVAEVNGGYEVTVAGKRAFCPYSQINLHKQEGAQYIGRTFAFAVSEYDPEENNIVVSRRPILEREQREQLDALKASLEVGQTVEGRVTRIVDFGFFVELGGAEGLVPLKELSWRRDVKPADVVAPGDRVSVLIRDIDWNKNRISLSFRATQADPFAAAAQRFPVGATFRGKITRIEPFGAFVEVEPGVEALVPISNLGNGRRINSPHAVLKLGDEIDFEVETIDLERRRMGLKPIAAAPSAAEIAAQSEEEKALEELRAKKPAKGFGGFGNLLDDLSL